MSAWGPSQAKSFAASLRKEIGDGWKYFTADTRRAYAARAVLSVVRMQVRPVDSSDVDALLADVERALGLYDN